MSGVSNKHNRDQSLEFHDLLNDLQNWEYSLKDKDKKLKGPAQEEPKVASSLQKSGIATDDRGSSRKAPIVEVHRPCNAVHSEASTGSNERQYDFLRNSDAITRISSTLLTEESSPSAASEKDQGNEYFKQKKFIRAIECYSRSIALTPTSVAYANRAMAYLRLKRFEDAENDCTEALNLDDHYVKAYSRRATARKELGKLKASIEDSEFALRLEPNNQELKKQYSETKALYHKELANKASGAAKSSQGIQNGVGPKVESVRDVQDVHSVSSISQRPAITPVQTACIKKSNDVDNKYKLKTAVEELASRVASRAMAAAAKNLVLPTSAYQFGVSWRGFSDDRGLQAELLKIISPSTLPQLFKSALSVPILVDIVKCIATFFMEETHLAVSILENLAKVARFDLIIMCLSAADKADLHRLWDEVFCSEAALSEHGERLTRLHAKYCPGQWPKHVLGTNGWRKEMS